jgi:hypothetical protein
MSTIRYGKASSIVVYNLNKNKVTIYNNNKKTRGRKPFVIHPPVDDIVSSIVSIALEKNVAPDKEIIWETNKNRFTWNKEGLFRLNKTLNQTSKLSPTTSYSKHVATNMVLRNVGV